MTREVEYSCGCKAAGDNVAPFCPKHNNAIVGRTYLECRAMALRAEVDELQQSFDLRWEADMRAIKRWHEAGNPELTWPDHADLVVWLLEQLKCSQADYNVAVGKFDDCRSALARVYETLTGNDAIPPESFKGEWHEWLIAELDKGLGDGT